MIHLPRWTIIVRPLGILLTVLPLLLAAPPPVAGAASVEITPTSRDGEFKFDVRGFSKTETLSTWLTGPSQQIVRTNDYEAAAGKLKFNLFMPRHFQPGRWAITIVGQRSGRQVIAVFDVPERGANTEVTLSGASLRPGDTITVTTAGYGPEERISYWLTRPDGSAARGVSATVSARDGTVEFPLTITDDLELGGWALSIYGDASDSYGIATFEIVG